MALSNTAQPINTSLRKIAVVVATAVAGMSTYAQAAETSKKKKPSPLLPHLLRRKVPGDQHRQLQQNGPRQRPKPILQLRKPRSPFPW